jgi:hypothetical protein
MVRDAPRRDAPIHSDTDGDSDDNNVFSDNDQVVQVALARVSGRRGSRLYTCHCQRHGVLDPGTA